MGVGQKGKQCVALVRWWMSWRTSDEVLHSGLTALITCNTLSEKTPIGNPFSSADKSEGYLPMYPKINVLRTMTSVLQVKLFNQLHLEIMIKYGTQAPLSA
jgi:hypothetical protein